MLQHPAMADDDIFPISLRFRDLLRQIADTITTCPEMRADVSTLRVIARSRTTCIDKEIDRLGPRSFYGYLVSSISMEIVGSISFLPIDHPRIATMILRPIDPLSYCHTATLASSPNTTLLAGVLLLVLLRAWVTSYSAAAYGEVTTLVGPRIDL